MHIANAVSQVADFADGRNEGTNRPFFLPPLLRHRGKFERRARRSLRQKGEMQLALKGLYFDLHLHGPSAFPTHSLLQLQDWRGTCSNRNRMQYQGCKRERPLEISPS